MAQAPTRYLYSAEDLLEMEEGDSYELDDGELREVTVGAESQDVADELQARLRMFLHDHPLGRALPLEVGLQIFPGRPRRIPRADGGFIATGRLPGDRLPKGFLTVAPDLVVEAVSPNDDAEYTRRKVREYLSAGVRLVWVLWPEAGTADVYRVDGTSMPIQPDGYLDGEDVIPGFRCALADIMPPEDPS